jgi:hypothetical protein
MTAVKHALLSQGSSHRRSTEQLAHLYHQLIVGREADALLLPIAQVDHAMRHRRDPVSPFEPQSLVHFLVWWKIDAQ